jgi:hypothetical protein
MKLISGSEKFKCDVCSSTFMVMLALFKASEMAEMHINIFSSVLPATSLSAFSFSRAFNKFINYSTPNWLILMQSSHQISQVANSCPKQQKKCIEIIQKQSQLLN